MPPPKEKQTVTMSTDSAMHFIDRPRTDIGIQGSHVTAYSLFEEFCRQLPTNDAIDTITTIKTNFDCIFSSSLKIDDTSIDDSIKDDIQQASNEMLSFLKEQSINIISPADISDISNRLKESGLLGSKVEQLKNSISISNQAIINATIEFAANKYLKIRNKLPYTSFPTEGNLPPKPNEGAVVKKALSTMRYESEKLRIASTIEDDQLQQLKTAIYETFWYPKIPEDKLIPLHAWKSPQWETARARYNQGATPRTNDLDTLGIVSARHLSTIFACFPSLRKEMCITNKIINGFIEDISKDWRLSEEERAIFTARVFDAITIPRQSHHERNREEVAEAAERNGTILFSQLTQGQGKGFEALIPKNTLDTPGQSPGTSLRKRKK
jgi:hypothetical protein